MDSIEAKIALVDVEINATTTEIAKVEAQLEHANEQDKVYLRKEKEQLRKKEEQLRKKEEQLREEKLLLMHQAEATRTAEVASYPLRSVRQRLLENLPTPSDMANSNVWSGVQEGGNPSFFWCFRPGVGQHGALPVGLYDPVLDELVALFGKAVEGGGGGEGELLEHADCEAASRLCGAMSMNFPSEAARTAQFTSFLREYVTEIIVAHHPNPLLQYVTDGSMICLVEGYSVDVPVYIQEMKCEIGQTGDPYFQGQRYYQLYVTNPELAAVVRRTVMPVLFVELVGPHLRVSALASPVDAVVVCEPLTPYLHLFSMHRCQPAHMSRVARVLRALKRGVGLLKDACANLRPTPSPVASSAWASSASASAAGPAGAASAMAAAAAAAAVPQRDPSLQLPYTLRPGSGFRSVQAFGPGACNPLYSAVEERSGRAVAVKFTRLSVHATRVHRAWAKAGLAPELLEERPLPCGLTMLVMELLAPQDGWTMFHSLAPELKQQLHGVVVGALREAHGIDVGEGARGVHADMRQANVMVRLPCGAAGGGKPQVMFVDFDWSGLEGSTRLPAFSRMRLEGYGCGSEVTQAYDVALWSYESLPGAV